MIEFVVDINIKCSLSANRIYSGIHYSIRQSHIDLIHGLTIQAMKEYGIEKKPLNYPVKCTYWFDDRLDLSNNSYVMKMIEDAMKGWIIKDDSRNYIKQITMKWWNGGGVKVRVEKNE